MTNYHISRIDPIGPDSDYIDPQNRDRGIKLQFHCMNTGRTMSDLVAILKPTNQANGRLVRIGLYFLHRTFPQ